MKIGEKILEYADEMLETLAGLIAIPSVCGRPEEGMPYGKPSAEALQYILEKARGMGFSVVNVGNYAGHAEYGQGEEIAAVLAHVDVVPPGRGWDTDPFALARQGDLLFGRGMADDKGAAVVALYCLKALKDQQVIGKRRLRVIFGAGEEVGMDDLEQYFAKEPLPDLAFTPDAEYGICNREKGILQARLSCAASGGFLRSFSAGSVVNAVPERAVAELGCTDEEAGQLQSALPSQSPASFSLEKQEGGWALVCKGVAAHAMCPEEGVNAAAYLLDFLCRHIAPERLGRLPVFLHKKIGTAFDGAALGIAQADKPSGPLTLNLGTVQIRDGQAAAQIDIRFPVTSQGEAIIQAITEQAEREGVLFSVGNYNPPLYLPEESRLISVLQEAYAAVMGERPSLYATGGGTYARAVKGRGVAFGPVFPDEPDRRMHNSNEHIDWKRFLLHAQICLEAMYRMLTQG